MSSSRKTGGGELPLDEFDLAIPGIVEPIDAGRCCTKYCADADRGTPLGLGVLDATLTSVDARRGAIRAGPGLNKPLSVELRSSERLGLTSNGVTWPNVKQTTINMLPKPVNKVKHCLTCTWSSRCLPLRPSLKERVLPFED